VALVAIIVAVAVHFLGAGPSSSTSASSRGSAVPVAVFNARSTPDAAHELAARLKGYRFRLGTVGNISASLGSGVYVFYPPGAQARARRIAQLVPNLSPTVAPIQPQVQNVVGKRDEIVVIFD
jgi:hypothetical protein